MSLLGSDCGLGSDFELEVLVMLESKAAQWKVNPVGTLNDSQDKVELPIVVEVPGSDMAGTLKIRTCIVVRSPGVNSNLLAAERPGTILWEHLTQVMLEGDGPRMPIALVDFSSLRNVAERAAWWIKINLNDLDAPYVNAIRVFVNRRWSGAAEMIATGSAHPASPLFLGLLHCELQRTMVTQSLQSEEFIARASFPPGSPEEGTAFPEDSIGAALLKTIRWVFPDEEIEQLRERLEYEPSAVEADIQSKTFTLPAHHKALA